MTAMRSDEATDSPTGAVRPLPTWLDSTAHSDMPRVTAKKGICLRTASSTPRQIGCQSAACGVTAVDWELFWDAAFPSKSTSPCPEGIRVVARPETDPRGLLPPS